MIIFSGFCFFEHRILKWTINPFFALLLIFNYKSLTTYTSDYVSYADCVQDGNVKFTGNDTLQSQGGKLYLDAKNIFTGTGLESIYIDFNLFNTEDEYRCITDYKYTLKIYDLYESDIEPAKVVTVDVDKPASFYVPLNIAGSGQSLRFEFPFGDEYQFSINDFRFNAAKPFDVSYIRIVITFVTLICLYFATIAITRKGKNYE